MKLLDFIKQALTLMAPGVGLGFGVWGRSGMARSRGPARRGAGAATAAVPGKGFSLHTPPAPAGAAGRLQSAVPVSASSGPSRVPSAPRHRLLRELTDGFAVQTPCSAASGMGKMFCLCLLPAGPEAIALLSSPSLHVWSSNLQEDSASFYSRCQQ